ncbi:unnamed protein product [Ectocarpus fasciculatus]
MASFAKYQVPPGLATAFTPNEVAELRENFQLFDKNGDGTIDARELSEILTKLGEHVSAGDVAKYLADADTDGDHKVSFNEFVTYVNTIRTGGSGSGALASIVKKAGGMLKVEGAGGATHTFSQEEKIAFSEHINQCLAGDPACGRHLPLPTDQDSMALFERANDGLILCKLINMASADTIDERAINKKESMNVYQKTENQNLALNAAKAIGCQVVNIGAQDLIEGRPILILGLVWQIIKIQLMSQISLKNFPELILLLNDGEDMGSLLKLHPEDILLRWFNHHLEKAGSSRRVTNFSGDVKDSECYSILLHQLNPSLCALCTEPDALGKATHVISNARAIGAAPFIQPTDITTGNKKLNLGFVAQLFNTCPGLEITQEQLNEYDFADLELDDAGDSREERVFRMWINSLNIDGLYINELFSGLADGVGILKIEDRVSPGSVNWKRVNLEPKSKFKCVENCNYAVDVGKCPALGFSLVGIGGIDIVDKKKKLVLAIIWQAMRKYTLQVLKDLAKHEGITDVTENHIVDWANRKVASSGKTTSMRSFRDSELKTGRFMLDLVAAIEPRAVNWDLVTSGATPEEALSNSKYSISIARKIGACVFLTPEDITEVKSKMLMTYVASLWATDLTYVRA